MFTEGMPKEFVQNRLKAYRKANGLTQLQVANALGIDRSTYTYYETGRSEPGLELLDLICRIYNTKISDFLDTEAAVQTISDPGISPRPDNEAEEENTELTVNSLTKDEQDLILKFRLYSKKQKEELLISLDVKEKK